VVEPIPVQGKGVKGDLYIMNAVGVEGMGDDDDGCWKIFS
jgi:hypothetical protein